MDLEMPGLACEMAHDLRSTEQFLVDQLAQPLQVVQLHQSAFRAAPAKTTEQHYM